MTDHAVHEFRLLLSDARVVEDYDAADHLFEAGFDDVTFGVHAGVPFADVSRAGVSLEAVVIDTIDSIEDALAPTVVVRVEPDELVTASRIAERIGRTRQSVALLISGERGPGGFPAPLTFVDAQTRVWSWTEVQSWLQASTEIEVESALSTLEGEFLAALNGVLATRAHLRRYLASGGEPSRAAALRRLADPVGGTHAEPVISHASLQPPVVMRLQDGLEATVESGLPPETDTLLRLASRVADRARDCAWADERAPLILCAVSAFDAGIILRAHRRETARECDLVVHAAARRLVEAKDFGATYTRCPVAPSPDHVVPHQMHLFCAPHHSSARWTKHRGTVPKPGYGFASFSTPPEWEMDVPFAGSYALATRVNPVHDVDAYVTFAAEQSTAGYSSFATPDASFALIAGLATVAAEWMSADDRHALSELMHHARSELVGRP